MARGNGWTGDAHFSVDGMSIEKWARRKSFQTKEGPGPRGTDPSISTRTSATAPEAQLARKRRGRDARLSFGPDAPGEDRDGSCVQALVRAAQGVT